MKGGSLMAFKGTVLDLQTSYSLLSSTITIPALIDFYKKNEVKTAAIADDGVLSGVIPFYKACKKENIKPLIGMRVTVQWTEETSTSILLFAENNTGYNNLLKISSAIQTVSSKGIPVNWLSAYKQGLLLIDSSDDGLFLQFLHERIERDLVERVVAEFSLFAGIPPKTEEKEDNIRTRLLTVTKDLGVMPIATPVVRYMQKEEKLAHSVLSCIRENEKLSDRHAWHQVPDQHMWTGEEWEKGYYDYPELLENLLQFTSRCEVQIELANTHLPKYPIDQHDTPQKLLRSLCEDRMNHLFLMDKPQYVERLNYEVKIIEEMGFVDYFLIVWDFMRFARESSIITGPGRGSAAGSLVAYLLQITKVDPIKYGLLFERFLNPDRISLPDIDIDFPDHRRDDVIEYVANKYGKKHVAQIVTFGTLAAKAAIRDTGRTFGLSTKELEQWSRLIPSKPGTTLDNVYHQSKELRSFIQETDQNQQMWLVAKTIEGLPRHASTHAAGIIISPFPLVEKVPLLHGGDDIPLTQFTMDILESIGLLKMDFLGLRNLSLLERMQSLIKQTTNKRIDWDELPLEDKRTYKLLQRGDTTGVFQLESEGMRKALQLIKPTEFSDIVAVNALYRPGPMAQIPLYQKRKEKIENYQENEPVLKEVLQETYGIIVYQEQIMQIAHKVAGFTLGEADLLRRAVSKKSEQVLQEQRQKFVKGSVNNGYSQERAVQLYDLIVQFAQYGFNKSHAVAYSMISYQLAYAKAHFPLEFLSVLLTSSIGNQDRLAMLLMEAKETDVTILPPSINRSHFPFIIEGTKLRYSLGALKGIPSSALKEILSKREAGPYKNIFDLVLRVSSKLVNRKTLETLILSGALDEFSLDRATLLATIDVAYEHKEFVQPFEDDLFQGDDTFIPEPKVLSVEPMPLMHKLAHEKDVFGFYFSDHPIKMYSKGLKKIGAKSLSSFLKEGTGTAGVYVVDVRRIRTKKGDQMAFIRVSDEFSEAEAVVFPDLYKKVGTLLTDQQLLFIKGKVETRNDKQQIIMQDANLLTNILEDDKESVYINIKGGHDATVKEKVKELITSFTGPHPLYIRQESDGKLYEWKNGVSIQESFLHQLRAIIGKENVVVK